MAARLARTGHQLPVNDRVRPALPFEARAPDRRVDGVRGCLLGVEVADAAPLAVRVGVLRKPPSVLLVPTHAPELGRRRRRREARSRLIVCSRGTSAPVASTAFVLRRPSRPASLIALLYARAAWTDFTPTVEKMFILFAQFGKLSQMLVYPLQYIPLETDLTQFDTFPIHNKKKDERTPSL